MELLLTDEAIAIISDALKRCHYGTWDEGERMEAFLREQAEKIHESISDSMSRPES